MKHLSDPAIYKPIPDDPTQKLVEAINTYIQTLHRKGYLSNHMRDYLMTPPTTKVRTQQLYFLKKIHKGPHCVRPIVSGSGGPTERLSAFLDHFLQPLVPQIPSYTRDSGHLINHLEELTFPSDCILAVVDVSALYLSIPHDEGLNSSIHHLYQLNQNAEEVPFPPSAAKELISTVLKQNFFEFNNRMYHQIRGTAMGTKMAPAYANIFMAELEKSFWEEQTIQPLLYRRYIDDILIIWGGTEEELEQCLRDLNNHHDTIKFTHTISKKQVEFLDMCIGKGERFALTGKLDISPFYKKTNLFQYLHWGSAHPRSTFRGIVKGELTRILRASSSPTTYNANVKLLTQKFRNRHYPANLLREVLNEMPFSKREQTLREKEKKTNGRPPFIVTYSDQIPRSALTKALAPPPELDTPIISYKRDKTVGDTIVRARLPNRNKPNPSADEVKIRFTPTFTQHSTPCGQAMCSCCKTMSKKEVVYSTDGTPFRTPQGTNCMTPGVVYMIECPTCTKKHQYIGQTGRSLKERMGGHRAAYTKGKNMPIYRHFRRRDHPTFDKAKVTILELVTPPTQTNLLQAEAKLIKRIGTRIPKGLNSNFDRPPPEPTDSATE